MSVMSQVNKSNLPKASPAPAESPGKIRLLVGLLVLATLVSYLNNLAAPFIFDDRKWIIDAPQMRDLTRDWRRLDVATRPVVFFSLAMNYQIGHLDVRGYHIFNIVIHVIAGLLLFGIVRRTIELHSRRRGTSLPGSGLAFAAALLWLVHPLQTESVTYVIQRCESMMGMFFLLCVYCVLRGSQGARGWPWYLASFAACLLGLGCKEVMATAPAVVLLYDRVFLSASWREVLRRRGWLYGLLFGSVLALVVVMLPTIQGARDSSAGFSDANPTAWEYLRSQPAILLHYLRLAGWPRPLCLDYGWQPAQSPAEFLPAATAVLALLLGSVIAFRYRSWLGFLGLSFFFVLAPTSSIIPIRDLAVEHRMYVSLSAVTVVAVLLWFGFTQWIVRDPVARRLARVGPATVAALLLMGLTVQRNADYCDPLRMWSKVVKVAPHNPRGHFSLGATYNLRGNSQRAKVHFERAIALAPDYARAHGNLGMLLVRQGELERGEEHIRRALELSPNYAGALVNLGNLLARQQNWRQAVAYYRQAVQVEPYDNLSRQNLAVALLKMNKPSEAVSTLREALRLNPHSADVRIRLAWVLATCVDARVRDGKQALLLANEALSLVGGQQLQVVDTLAAAYAELGQYDEACQAASRCLEIARKQGLKDGLRDIENRLAVYRSRKPFREDVTRSALSTIRTEPNQES
jgi:tetratricopeptide (TPR) repeat protein